MNYFRGAVLGVLCILLSNFEAGLAQSTAKSNSSDPLRLTVTVTGDDLKPAAGLPQHLFTVSDDTGVRKVLSFSNEDVPLSIAIIFDLSRSVGSEFQGNRVKLISEALSDFVLKSNPLNEYFIITFAKTTSVLVDGSRDPDSVLTALRTLASAKAHGDTALYDACRFGIGKVKQGTHNKQVILLISDGLDNRSRMTLDDLRNVLKQETILVYALNAYTGKPPPDVLSEESAGARELEDLASLTGGITYSPTNKAELRTSLERIALELRQQYSIVIDSANDVSGRKWRSLKVKVATPSNGGTKSQGLTARTRRGYYAGPKAKR